MKYYKAKAYIKPEGKKRYSDITEEERIANYLGEIIIKDNFSKGVEVTTRLEFDVCVPNGVIRYDKKRLSRFGRDIFIDEVSDEAVGNAELNQYLIDSNDESFCLFLELCGRGITQKKKYK